MTTEMSDSPGKPRLPRAGGKAGSNHEPERDTPVTEPRPPADREGERCDIPGDRWLCSELVFLEWADVDGVLRSQTVNLEEIWPRGAILDAEEHIPAGTRLRIRPEPAGLESAREEPSRFSPESQDAKQPIALYATAAECPESAAGYTLRVEFDAGSEWNPERLPLSHGVSSGELRRKAAEAAANAPGEGGGGTAGRSPDAASDAAGRAADEALEQGSLFCLALQASRR